MTNASVVASRPKAARKLSLRFNSFVRWTHVYVSVGGYSADVFIDRRTRKYERSLIQHGTLGKWNDLHKGRDSGIPWSIMIDISAIVMISSAATGLTMLFFLKRKRISGLASALCGALIFAAFYVFFIP